MYSPFQSFSNTASMSGTRTMLADLIRISDEALTEALSSAPDNGCAYLEKKGKTNIFVTHFPSVLS